jgi:hypothetical protein
VSPTTYYLDSLVPSWLAVDPGYVAALGEHLVARVELQGYQVVQGPFVMAVDCDARIPVGMTLVRAEVHVEEFDIDLTDDADPPAGQWLARQTDDFTAHSVPLDDVIVHEFTEDCPCGPTPAPTPRNDGAQGWVVSHHSLDGREQYESPFGAAGE